MTNVESKNERYPFSLEDNTENVLECDCFILFFHSGLENVDFLVRKLQKNVR